MREQIEVVYENGVLRPLEVLPSHLQEHQRLTVTLEEVAGANDWLADSDPTVFSIPVRSPNTTAPNCAQLTAAYVYWSTRY